MCYNTILLLLLQTLHYHRYIHLHHLLHNYLFQILLLQILHMQFIQILLHKMLYLMLMQEYLVKNHLDHYLTIQILHLHINNQLYMLQFNMLFMFPNILSLYNALYIYQSGFLQEVQVFLLKNNLLNLYIMIIY